MLPQFVETAVTDQTEAGDDVLEESEAVEDAEDDLEDASETDTDPVVSRQSCPVQKIQIVRAQVPKIVYIEIVFIVILHSDMQ